MCGCFPVLLYECICEIKFGHVGLHTLELCWNHCKTRLMLDPNEAIRWQLLKGRVHGENLRM
eukprot:m.110223 g.110223  ORF g.110223 m.110223 type:complete len:62 (+) comp14029_c1_seq2:457-642(+)